MVNTSFLLTAVQQIQSTLTLHCLVQNIKIRRIIIISCSMMNPRNSKKPSMVWYGYFLESPIARLYKYVQRTVWQNLF